nr:universal stress protein [Actinacidiphila oryziradicis]
MGTVEFPLVVGVDGSDSSLEAVDWAVDEASRHRIPLRLVYYKGDAAFLTGPAERTRAVWGKVSALFAEERRKGILDVDTATPSTITSHRPGFIDRDRELIVGLQTDARS